MVHRVTFYYLFLTACQLCFSLVQSEVCIGTLPNFQHDIAGRLCFIDQTTLVIRDFEYDGGGPAAYLYYYETGEGFMASNIPRNGGGNIIPHPQTLGKLPRERVSGQDLQFSLPDGVYACDMAVFTIWCDLANTHFTAINIPQDIFSTSVNETTNGDEILCTRESEGGNNNDGGPVNITFDNCQQLDTGLSLSWTVDRSSDSVQFMLCGCTATDTAQDNTWLGFGLSGSTFRTQMFGADATIVWVDDEDGPQAEDYFLSTYSQCRGGVGACPDTEDSSGVCVNDATFVQGFKKDGQQCVVFSRNFAAGDECDLTLDPDNEEQYIVWGVGGLGETAFRHFTRAKSGAPPLHLGRASSSDCVPLQCLPCDPFQNQRIEAPSSNTFVVHIGPSGDERGYMGITGRAGWGIAWYINDTLIPELVVQRGQTYTFIVYGGDDPTNPARYHPFYITDSPSGGRLINTRQEILAETVYAGFNGEEPVGVGPLCEYQSTATAIAAQEDCNSPLSAYEAGLAPPASNCGAGVTTNVFTWTPDDDTPDLVYYQCATHINLGWRIRVETGFEDGMGSTGSIDGTDPTGSIDGTEPTGSTDGTDPTGSIDGTDPTGNTDGTEPTGSTDGEVCIGTLPNFQHDIAGRLCFIDQTTLVIRGFGYDGRGPAAYLYYYETGEGFMASNIPRNGGGNIIPHPQTLGKLPRERVSGQDLQFSLPDGVYACDMAVFTIWCDLANTHFTAINIPQDIFSTSVNETTNGDEILCTRESEGGNNNNGGPVNITFDNCQQLDTGLSLSWTVDRSSDSVQFMLCGCTATDTAQDNTWLGFGLSGSTFRTQMFGADATIVWVDDEDGPQAEDYFLSTYSQCRGGVGACPDTEDSSGACVNDATFVQGFKKDGQQCVVFSRNFAAGDECDLTLDPDNEEQYIVWGVGGLGETAFRHFTRAKSEAPPLHLGRASSSDCVPLQCLPCDPFQNQRIDAPSSNTFVAHIGPSGDERGYMGITGRAGWGIAWYINDTLIPELVVQRGQTYTFIVYGGDDPTSPARYHPFYITDSPSGGRLFKTRQEILAETVYAGFNGEEPVGVGPLCEYQSTATAIAAQEDCNSPLSAYEAGLAPPASNCGAGVTTNVFTWTPDDDTPDLVYYQCATHINLGWRIRVETGPDDGMGSATFSGNGTDSTDPTGSSSDGMDPDNSSDGMDPTGSTDGTDPDGMDPTGSTDGSTDDTDPTGSTDGTDPTGSTDGMDPTGSADGTDLTGSTDGPDPTGSTDHTDPTGSTDGMDPTSGTDGMDPTGSTDGTDPDGMDPTGSTDGSADGTDPTGSTDGTDSDGSTDAMDPTSSTDGMDPTGSIDDTDPTGSTDGTDPTGSTDGTDPTSSIDGTDPTGSTDGTDPDGNTDGTDPTGSMDPTSSTDGTDPTGSTDGMDPDGSTDGTDPDGSTDGTDPDSDIDGMDSDGDTDSVGPDDDPDGGTESSITPGDITASTSPDMDDSTDGTDPNGGTGSENSASFPTHPSITLTIIFALTVLYYLH